jgi:nucleoside-diphosphate-sugar epimerase
MRMFVTGVTGHIGSLVVPELLTAGHEVLGLLGQVRCRVGGCGAELHRGTLDDLGSPRAREAVADGVIRYPGVAALDAGDSRVAANSPWTDHGSRGGPLL